MASILLLGLLFSVVFVLVIDHFSTAPVDAGRDMAAMYMPSGYVPIAGQPMPAWAGGFWHPTGVCQERSGQVNAEQSNVHEETEEEEFETAEPVPAYSAMSVLGTITAIDLASGNYDDKAFAARCRLLHTDPSCAERRAVLLS